MSDTLGALKLKVRRRLDETNVRFWKDEDLTDWINEGAREVARRAEVLQHTTSINAVANLQQYSLPNDTFRVHRVEWSRDGNASTALEYRDFNSMDSIWWSQQRTSTGDPYWYTMWGFPPQLNLIVYPTPDTDILAAFKVFYYRLPGLALTDTQVVEVPAGWDDVILDYCEFSAMRKDADPRWQEAKALFEDKLGHMVDSTRRWTDASGTFTSGSGPLPRWIWDDGLY
jgi:hypothetical protein